MAGATLSLEERNMLSEAAAAIRAFSPEFAKAAEHLGCAMRTSYLQLAQAIASADLPSISAIIDRIRNSEVISAQTNKFRHLGDRVRELYDALYPWAKVIGGLVVGLAGYFLAAELGIVLAACLVIGGFVYAAVNAIEIVFKAASR